MNRLTRRTFLRGTGICLALPFLEAMLPASARAAAAAASTVPRRFVAINIPLGFLPENFFPQDSGAGYKLSPYLKIGESMRDHFTVFSGVSHPGVDGGHETQKSFLTAARHPAARSFKNTVSVDQVIAKVIGDQTRFASLTMGEHSLSTSMNGVVIPREGAPGTAFKKLFMTGTPKEIAEQEQDLRDGHSVMDAVMEDAKTIGRHASTADKEKLDQYFTAVRETEERIAKSENWSKTPKPKIEAKPPGKFVAEDLVDAYRSYFDVMRLAIQTDSTRVMTLGGTAIGTVPKIDGVAQGYHTLSHHGKDPERLHQLEIVERETMKTFFNFLNDLQQSKEGNATLLDRTQIFMGSNLGNASGHSTNNLPAMLAGGGFKHGQHLAFDTKSNYPLSNLFVSMIQRMGISNDTFGEFSGTMRGLEMIG